MGTLVTPMAARYLSGDSSARMHVAVVASYAIISVFSFLHAWSPNIVVYLLANLLRSGGTTASTMLSNILLQGLVPDKFRGRVFSFDMAALTVAQIVRCTCP